MAGTKIAINLDKAPRWKAGKERRPSGVTWVIREVRDGEGRKLVHDLGYRRAIFQ